MKALSIVIPVYNEVKTIKKVIQRVKEVNIEKEIIVVDDCSTDGTREILQQSKEDGIKVFFHDKNEGKGAALQTGFKYITGEVVIIQDADLEYNPQEYITLLEPICEGKADIVYGSRFMNRKNLLHYKHFFYLTHFIGNKFLNFLIKLLYRTKITDMETCYKAIKSSVLKDMKLSARGFDIEPEITAQLLRKGFKILEVPISYSPRDYKEGKKISWKDGFTAIFVLLKYRFKKKEWGMNVVFDTLTYMSKLDRMNRLLYKRIKPYIGKRILEAGCGTGNLTSQLLDRELVIAIDNDEAMLNEVRKKFSQYHNLKISRCDLTDSKVRELSSHNIDTIVCSNTLEHIKEDSVALSSFNAVLGKGNLIVVVPAFKFLYSSLDKAAGHYRRYGLRELSNKLEKSGFVVTESMYANFFGILGWFFNGKLLRRQRLSKNLLSLFNFLTPLFELFEKLSGPPIGLSIILICRKKYSQEKVLAGDR